MLEHVLDLLRSGGVQRITDLAEELKTTPELVEAMLDQLAHMGYVRVLKSECHSGCDSCSLAEMCTSASSGRAWALTDDQAR